MFKTLLLVDTPAKAGFLPAVRPLHNPLHDALHDP
jgi:hypothetical protein